jgi:hypothetical protein
MLPIRLEISVADAKAHSETKTPNSPETGDETGLCLSLLVVDVLRLGFLDTPMVPVTGDVMVLHRDLLRMVHHASLESPEWIEQIWVNGDEKLLCAPPEKKSQGSVLLRVIGARRDLLEKTRQNPLTTGGETVPWSHVNLNAAIAPKDVRLAKTVTVLQEKPESPSLLLPLIKPTHGVQPGKRLFNPEDQRLDHPKAEVVAPLAVEEAETVEPLKEINLLQEWKNQILGDAHQTNTLFANPVPSLLVLVVALKLPINSKDPIRRTNV